MHSRIAQDVLSHFALREGKVGSAFEAKSFWRLAVARDVISHELLETALIELVDDGCLVSSSNAHFLTQKGYDHIFGEKERLESSATDDALKDRG